MDLVAAEALAAGAVSDTANASCCHNAAIVNRYSALVGHVYRLSASAANIGCVFCV